MPATFVNAAVTNAMDFDIDEYVSIVPSSTYDLLGSSHTLQEISKVGILSWTTIDSDAAWFRLPASGTQPCQQHSPLQLLPNTQDSTFSINISVMSPSMFDASSSLPSSTQPLGFQLPLLCLQLSASILSMSFSQFLISRYYKISRYLLDLYVMKKSHHTAAA